MGVRITDLRKPVQPIAKKFVSGGFSMTDIISIGLLFLADKDANDIASLRMVLSNTTEDRSPVDILAAFADEIAAAKKSAKKRHKRPRRLPPRSA